jgi:glycosyltransferase involved in cell wall biosynthesis
VADGARAFQSGVWIDLTRILTRVGQAAPTGIDRVELAWARHLLENSRGLHGVCRTTRGFLLLRPDGIRALLSMLSEAGAGTMRADRWSRITGRGDRPRHKAEAALRPLAIDRAPPWGLQAMARRYRPSVYLNLGHSNHSARVLRPMRQCGARVVVLIHDLIPLTHPDIVPAKQPARFARRIAQVRAHASLVVAVSGDTESALRAHWSDGPAPPIVRAEIGVEVPDPPVAAKSARGRFLMVGTLEPRKNHAVVLDAWEGLAGDMAAEPLPRLQILGQPGWCGAEIAARIRAHPGYGTTVFLDTAACDRTLRAAYSEADTLLYPSLAEGFGLPPHEALDRGLLPICADIPSLRAGLGDAAVYLDPRDVYSWEETIRKRISGKLDGPRARSAKRPGWQDHFEKVAAALAELRD